MIQFLFQLAIFLHTSVYGIHFNTSNGQDNSFDSFAGKKIMIVNIATGSTHVGQLAKLEQLYQQYHDSLVIVAFPSNSFGAESRTDMQILQFCNDNYHTTFTIAGKGEVTGATAAAIYKWLSNSSDNGVTNIFIAGDFQKVLIDGQGEIMGIYAPDLDPMSTIITNSITNN